MPEAPEVSVVIPTRNRWPFLSMTLAGALCQEDVDLEVIVVDDASTDETWPRLAEIQDRRLRRIRHDGKKGVARARNTAMAAARGEWLAFLDDDDFWSPRKLRTQLDTAAARGASFVYAAAVIVDEQRGDIVPDVPPPDPSDLPRALLVRNVIPSPGSNVMARTELVRRLGGFDEGAGFEDWDLCIRLSAAAPGASCPAVLVGYRWHSGNRALGDRRDLMTDLEYLAEKHHPLCVRCGAEFDRLEFSRYVGSTYRRAGRRSEAALAYWRGAWRYRNLSNAVRAAAALFGDWGKRRASRQRTPDWLDPYLQAGASSDCAVDVAAISSS
jgi:glycosyltransferase involved in cell wall biosynthesis